MTKTLIWDQSAGTMSLDGKVIGHGYAGADLGKNNPAMQDAKGVGPVPRGRWQIAGEPYDSGNTGKYTLALQPCLGTDTCGRGDFRIHGDSIAHPGSASHGCIILPRPVREAIWASGARALEVVA